MIYQTFRGAGNEALAIANQGVKLVLPLWSNLHIVEFGVETRAADPTGLVLNCQIVDCASASNATTLAILTVPTAGVQGEIFSARVDIQVERVDSKYVVSLDGDPGTFVADTDGLKAVQLNLTTGVNSVTGTVYCVAKYSGTPSDAVTGQRLITATRS